MPYAGPGHWHDMDMLLIGNGCVSLEEEYTQMAIWAISASPLIMGNDMRNVSAASKAILMNKDAIAVSQDPRGQMGIRLTGDIPEQIWARELANGCAPRPSAAPILRLIMLSAATSREKIAARKLSALSGSVHVSLISSQLHTHLMLLQANTGLELYFARARPRGLTRLGSRAPRTRASRPRRRRGGAGCARASIARR